MGRWRDYAESPIGDLALGVLRKQFGALRDHEAGTRLGSDTEELHDMRVATRRGLGAALRCFEDVLPEEAADLRRELGWLGRSLSAVRDLDVQLDNLDALRGALPPAQSGVVEVRPDPRGQPRGGAAHADSGVGFRALPCVAGYVETFLAGEVEYRVDATVAAEAPRLVKKMYRRLRRLGDTLDSTSPSEDLHALRIGAKRVRLTRHRVRHGPVRRPCTAVHPQEVVKLQDVLGDQHDAEVAVAQLRSLVMERAELGLGRRSPWVSLRSATGSTASNCGSLRARLRARGGQSVAEVAPRPGRTRRATPSRWQPC